MKGTTVIAVILIATIFLSGCEFVNKLSRKKIGLLGGDYKVVYASDGHVKAWIVKDGKITSDAEKGYYFFWASIDGDSKEVIYVQTPIGRTYIMEFKPRKWKNPNDKS